MRPSLEQEIATLAKWGESPEVDSPEVIAAKENKQISSAFRTLMNNCRVTSSPLVVDNNPITVERIRGVMHTAMVDEAPVAFDFSQHYYMTGIDIEASPPTPRGASFPDETDIDLAEAELCRLEATTAPFPISGRLYNWYAEARSIGRMTNSSMLNVDERVLGAIIGLVRDARFLLARRSAVTSYRTPMPIVEWNVGTTPWRGSPETPTEARDRLNITSIDEEEMPF